jgi:hypothetical protein
MSIVTLNDRGVRSVTTFGSLHTGSMVFIKKLTASSSATLSFVDGTSDVVLDDTYKEYLFTFKDIHPATDAAELTFQANVAGGSGYNETITSTYFRAVHDEADSVNTLSYDANRDQTQATGFQEVASDIGNENDQSASGYLHLFNPSNTTFVKHFILRTSVYIADTGSRDQHVSGYFNTTSAIDEIQFKMSSGNIDAGDICLYGIL